MHTAYASQEWPVNFRQGGAQCKYYDILWGRGGGGTYAPWNACFASNAYACFVNSCELHPAFTLSYVLSTDFNFF